MSDDNGTPPGDERPGPNRRNRPDRYGDGYNPGRRPRDYYGRPGRSNRFNPGGDHTSHTPGNGFSAGSNGNGNGYGNGYGIPGDDAYPGTGHMRGRPSGAARNGGLSQIYPESFLGGKYDDEEGGINLTEQFWLVWYNKWIVLTIAAMVITAGYLYIQTIPNEYTADTRVIVESSRPDEFSLLSEIQNSTLLYQDPVELDVQMIKASTELSERVARRLLEQPTTPQGDTLPVLKHYGFGEDDIAQVNERLILNLPNEVDVEKESERGRGYTYMNMFTMTRTSTSAYESAFLINTYIEELLSYDEVSVTSTLNRTKSFLEDLIRNRQQSLRDEADRINEYKQGDWELVTDPMGEATTMELREYQKQVQKIELEQSLSRDIIFRLNEEKDYAVNMIAEGVSQGLKGWLDYLDQSILELEIRSETYVVEQPELRQDPNLNPEYAVILDRLGYLYDKRTEYQDQFFQSINDEQGLDQASIAEYILDLRQQIEREESQLENLELQKGYLQEEITSIQENYFDLLDRVQNLSFMSREMVYSEELYGALLAAYQETQIALQTQATRFRVLSPARVPLLPSGPNRLQLYLVTVILGFGAGVGLVILRNITDDTVRNPEKVERTGLQVLGATPDMDAYFDLHFRDTQTVEVMGLNVRRDVVSLLDPLASGSESFRRLRSSIEYARPDHPPQVITVTSSTPGEGKSITAMNMAVTYAQYGQRILIVDCDLRKPQVHKRLGVPREPGITDVLFGKATLDEAIRELPIENLSVLSCGFKIPNPAELMGSHKMADLIRRLRSDYELIILDTPPIQVVTDALPVSVHSDGVLLMARANLTELTVLKESKEELTKIGADVLGVIINSYDVEDSKSYYKYNYRYRYKYAYKYKYSYAYKDYRVDYESKGKEAETA